MKSSQYLLYVLRFSLYFIDGDQFIKETYFSLNSKKIYKAFYELLNNPTIEQAIKFFISFENLDYGADIIFLICQYLYDGLPFFDINLFFRLIIKKHFNTLNDLFDFPVNPNRSELILNLSNFFKIKYNKKDLTKAQVMELFMSKEEKNPQLEADKTKVDANKEIHEKNNINQNNINKDINTKKEGENSSKSNNIILTISEDIKDEKNDNSKTKIIEDKKEIITYEKFFNFLNMQNI